MTLKFCNHVENFAGDDGMRALDLVFGNVDLDGISRWEGLDAGGGNCFYATSEAALYLAMSGNIRNGWIVTGRFDGAALHRPICHAWLELGEARTVVDVSNLAFRPLYAMRRAEFLTRNNCRVRWQEVPFQRVANKARHAVGDGTRLDMRDFTKSLLAKTLRSVEKLRSAGEPSRIE